MDNLIAAIAFFVVVELIVFAAFSWRIKELEDRMESLEGIITWQNVPITDAGSDEIEKIISDLRSNL